MAAVAPEVNTISSRCSAPKKAATASLAFSYSDVASEASLWTALWILALPDLTSSSHLLTTDSGLWDVAALSRYTKGFPYTFVDRIGN